MINIEKTRKYYDQLTEADLCSCAYCQNYIKEIKAANPEIAVYLERFGADIEKPFEVIPVGPVNGMMLYSGVQYVILGTADHFRETEIGSIRVYITDSHPMTDIEEPHFVIEITPIYLKWTGEA